MEFGGYAIFEYYSLVTVRHKFLLCDFSVHLGTDEGNEDTTAERIMI